MQASRAIRCQGDGTGHEARPVRGCEVTYATVREDRGAEPLVERLADEADDRDAHP